MSRFPPCSLRSVFQSSAALVASFVAAVLLVPAPTVDADGPVFWEISRQEEIVKGDAQGVSIADNGALTPSPSFDLVFDTKEAYIWSSAVDSAGNIYLGTGHDGRIFKVEANGTGKMIYDAPELDITALATDSQGNLYAGTSPDGKIYKITPTGQQSVFNDPPDKYIWSLVFDTKTSLLYAGTGDKGLIYKIDSSGKSAVLADTSETNIVALTLDKEGRLVAGTDPSGLVLRVSRDGKVFALLDSSTQEIHAVSVSADGGIYAIGLNQQGGVRGPNLGVSTTSTLSSDGTVTITTDDQDSVGAQETPVALSTSSRSSKADGARSALFRINTDGSNDLLWRSNDALGFGLEPLDSGRILIGTNSKGRIYEVAPDRTRSLLIQSPEDQTSTVFSVGSVLYATSSNLGRLYRLGNEPVTEGTYTSPVRDTKFAGQWGVISWRGTGAIELQTRTGNTETPDATWSDWSAAYRNPRGDQITSPRARFIQWRATLRSPRQAGTATTRNRPAAASTSPRLESVAVAYLPKNQAPDIASLQVLSAGVALQETPLAVDPSIATSGLDPQIFGVVGTVPPRRFYQKGARTLTWQAADPNDDTLSFKVYYRSIADSEWHQLASSLSQSWFTIDLNRVPDGTYLFKVIASDAASNPSDRALTAEEITDAVEIDNTPPTIKVTGPTISDQTAEATFDVADTTGRITKGEYSVDGGSWQLIFPADGIADSGSESYKVKVKFDSGSEHVIAFRASDSSANVGTAKVTVSVRLVSR